MKSPSERKVSDGLYFQNQKPEKRVRACGTHPTHESRNRRPTVGCVAQATHAFGGWNGLCRLRWLESILEKAGQQISAMQAYEQTDLAMLSALARSLLRLLA